MSLQKNKIVVQRGGFLGSLWAPIAFLVAPLISKLFQWGLYIWPTPTTFNRDPNHPLNRGSRLISFFTTCMESAMCIFCSFTCLSFLGNLRLAFTLACVHDTRAFIISDQDKWSVHTMRIWYVCCVGVIRCHLLHCIRFSRIWRYQREVIRIPISKKNRQHNGKGQTMIYRSYTYHLRSSNMNPTTTGGELRCCGRVSSSCSTSGTRRIKKNRYSCYHLIIPLKSF